MSTSSDDYLRSVTRAWNSLSAWARWRTGGVLFSIASVVATGSYWLADFRGQIKADTVEARYQREIAEMQRVSSADELSRISAKLDVLKKTAISGVRLEVLPPEERADVSLKKPSFRY